MFLHDIEQGMIRSIILSCLSLFLLLTAMPTAAQSESGSAIISAVESIQKGNHRQAEEILKDIISADPKSDAAWYYLGKSYISQKDLDMAEECFSAACAIDSTNYWYRYSLATLYEMTGRPKETIRMYEALLKDFPKKSDLYFEMVGLYSSQGEFQKALDVITEIETVFGMTETIAIYRFNLLLQLQRPEQAYSSLEEYNRKYSSPYVLSVLADQSLQEFKDSTALKYYDEALELDPDYTPAILGKAETMRITRRYNEYFDLLSGYVSKPQTPAKAKTEYLREILQRTDANFKIKFRPRFDAVMQNTLEAHPTDSNVLNLVGVYHYSLGRQEQACDAFRKNAELHPHSASASAGYAEVLMYYQKWEELARQGRDAFKRFPQHVSFLANAVTADRFLDRTDDAIALCDEILKASQVDSATISWAYATKGDIHYEKHESKKAFKAYESALKYQPDYVYVLNNYAYYLCINRKKLSKACEMSRKTIEAEPDNATYLDTYGWILYELGKPQEAVTHFKRAMIYGGKDSPVILDHYAEVLFALKEYDRALVYWNKALLINNGEIEGLEAKVQKRKEQINKTK